MYLVLPFDTFWDLLRLYIQLPPNFLKIGYRIDFTYLQRNSIPQPPYTPLNWYWHSNCFMLYWQSLYFVLLLCVYLFILCFYLYSISHSLRVISASASASSASSSFSSSSSELHNTKLYYIVYQLTGLSYSLFNS